MRRQNVQPPADGLDHVGALVHNEDSSGAETRARFLQGIKVHAAPTMGDRLDRLAVQHGVADVLG